MIEDIRYLNRIEEKTEPDENGTFYTRYIPILQMKINGEWIDVPEVEEE